MPMSGCRYTLPCKVDTVSISDQARVARSELGYKKDRSSSKGAISINVTRGNLMMVAQCVMADMKTYLDGVMVLVGKTLAIQKMSVTLINTYLYSSLLSTVNTLPSTPSPLSLSPSTTAGYGIQYTPMPGVTTMELVSATPLPEVVPVLSTASNEHSI